jgi:hypothetical protein
MRKYLYILAIAFTTSLHLSAQSCWSALGAGAGSSNDIVSSIISFNSQLVAGGIFDTAGGVAASNVAAWNGSNWSAMGSGLNSISDKNGTKYSVRAFAVYKNELYAGGHFDSAGNVYASGIAKWNGTAWTAVGGGIAGYTYDGSDSLRAGIYAMAVYNNELYVAGNFTSAGGVLAHEIAKWNGSTWSAVASGLATGESNSSRTVICLAVANNKLYAGGSFKNASGVHATNIASWNGSAWAAVGTGLGNDSIESGGVTSLAFFQGDLCASVQTSDGVGTPAYYVSKWDGTNWSSVAGGPGTGVLYTGYPFALLSHGGYLYLAGQYQQNSGLTTLNGLSKWNGTAWSGVNDNVGTNYRIALTEHNSHLFVGGNFTQTGGVATANIAEYSCNPSAVANLKWNDNIQVYPNPSHGVFSIVATEWSAQTTLSVYNMLGERVFQTALNNLHLEFDLGQNGSGAYFYRIVNEVNQTIRSGILIVE